MNHAPAASPWRAELVAMLKLATPVVVVQLGLMSFGVVDTMMLGHYHESSALAAAGIGHLFSMLILLVGFGLLMGLDPLLTQAYGAKRYEAVAAHFKRGLVVALGLTVLATVGMWCAEGSLRLLRQDEELIGPATRYIKIVSFGNLGFLLTIVLRQTLQAMSIVAPLVKATLIGNVFNIVGNWGLIWGNWGLPEMGLEGSAVTTAASRTLLLVSFAYLSRSHWLPLWRMETEGATRRGYGALLALGLPLSLQLSMEAGIFNAVGFRMGTKGVVAVAANQVTLNVASLVFMIPVGIGAAVATRVGNAIGEGDLKRASYSARIAMILATSFMVVSGAVFILAPQFIAGFYCEDHPDVLLFAATLIPVAGYFSIFDGVQCIAHGILRGMADTKVPAFLSLVAFWVIGFPLGMWLDQESILGPPGLWWGLVAGLATMAITLCWRIVVHFKRGVSAYEEG
ncbi:MAG: MATE family multidrug resistance protein [Planctomycetota bacterium]|jgi:MATE family multidrug resistance protein